MALEIQGRRRRDKISLGNPADSGLIAGCREIPFRTRMHGGPGKTQTSNEAVMTERIGARFRKSACGGSSLIRTLGIPI
jgi:hypothetical protein